MSKHDATSSSSLKQSGKPTTDRTSADGNPLHGEPKRVKPFLVDPADDFDFPPELQLPTSEDLLDPLAVVRQAEHLAEIAVPLAIEPPAIERVAPPVRQKEKEVEAHTRPAAVVHSKPDDGRPAKGGESTLWGSEDAKADAAPKRVRSKRVKRPDHDAALVASGPIPPAANPPGADVGKAVASAVPPALMRTATAGSYTGVLFIGDLHLASRVPGFRRDDYPKAILNKLRWVPEYARTECLLPVLLGDVFDFPRDNANWLLVELHQLLEPQTPAIYGNHDCKENTPGDHDSVSILVASGLLRLLSEQKPWTGIMNGCRVAVGGTCWGQKLPYRFDRDACFGDDESGEAKDRPTYVLWASHHDLRFPGFEEGGRMDCREVSGVDLVVNGHIHRELHDVSAGRTRWMNPGSITRISRSDATRQHAPGVLRVDVSPDRLACRRVKVPHQPFDEVFHPDVQCEPVLVQQSLFIRDLAKLQSVQTSDGVGLREFLNGNLHLFKPEVADEINLLADEVLKHAT